MLKRFYLDTSILLDFFEERGKNSEEALKLIKKIVENDDIIVISDLNINELKHLSYSYNEIVEMLRDIKKNLRKIHIYREEKEMAKKLALQRNIPKGDVLHAILAKNNESQLISRDEHFERLRDITIVKKPEEII